MGIVFIGGLLSSITPSLIFVPVLFSCVYDLELWAALKFQQRPQSVPARICWHADNSMTIAVSVWSQGMQPIPKGFVMGPGR